MPIIGGRAHTIEQLHEIGNLGYPFAELSLYEPEEVKEQIEDILRLKKAYNIELMAHYPNEGNPFDATILKKRFIPKMKTLFDLSEEIGITKSTFHFWIDKRWAKEELISAKIELVSEMVDHAKSRGITLCIENLSERHDSFARAFDAVPGLRMTLDIGHGQLLSSENTSFGFINNSFKRIAHVHVHDNQGGTSVKDDLHLPLGEGKVNYPDIFTLLKEKGYNSTITMEVSPVDMPRTKAEIERYI
ncbi:MAG: sugar phosphate isomerase/epimerase family protein [Thermodesulfobacteriota bacterium]|nr:sugar phosphate isomerase/epimerase family protein [Thermodesulfobacteriota bacterium]